MPKKVEVELFKHTLVAAAIASSSAAYSEENGHEVSEPQVEVLESIIVIAQRREERVQDVPFSVSVVSGENIDDAKIITVEDLARSTPSLNFGKAGSSRGEGLQIRGIGTASFDDGIEGAVGTVIDGVVIGRQGAGLNDLYDVERIEVLRGPQGTLFGKNTSAGLINIVTKRPTKEFEADFGLSYGTFNEVRLNGVVSGPVAGEKLTGRLSTFKNTRDGTIDQINEQVSETEVDNKDEWGFRGKLLYEASENLSFYLNSEFVKEDQVCCVRTERSFPSDPVFSFLGLDRGITPGPSNRQNNASSITSQESETKALSLEIENQFSNGAVFKSISAARNFETFEFTDTDNGPSQLVEFAGTDTDITQFSQEFQLVSGEDSNLSYVLGALYFDQEVDSLTSFTGVFTETSDTSIELTTFQPIGAGVQGFTLSPVSTDQPQISKTTNTAIFGQLVYPFSERWAITAGARVLHEKLEIDFSRAASSAVGQLVDGRIATDLVLPAGIGQNLSLAATESDTAVTGMLSLQYFLNDETTSYLTLSRGYKGQGLSFSPEGVGVLKPEVPTNLELGIKSHMLDNRLYLAATGFITDYRDFQSLVSSVTGFETTNIDNVRSQGVELEFIAKASGRLSLSGGIAWVNAEIESFDKLVSCFPGQTLEQGCLAGQTGQSIEGNSMPNSPELMANLKLDYLFYESSSTSAKFSVDYAWKDERNFSLNGNPRTVQEAYGLLNASLGIEMSNGLAMSLWTKNLLDEDYALMINENFLFPNSGGYQQYLGLERQVGFDIKYRF